MSSLFTILVGLVNNFWIIIVLRILTGIFNPVLAIIKSMLPDFVPETQAHKAMTFIIVVGAFGQTTGTAIGGWYLFLEKSFFHAFCVVLQSISR